MVFLVREIPSALSRVHYSIASGIDWKKSALSVSHYSTLASQVVLYWCSLIFTVVRQYYLSLASKDRMIGCTEGLTELARDPPHGGIRFSSVFFNASISLLTTAADATMLRNMDSVTKMLAIRCQVWTC